MLYFPLFILIIGVGLLLKYKGAKSPSSADAKIGCLLLLVSFILGLVSNLSGGKSKVETQQIDALERAKIMIPSAQWIQKWGNKGPISVFLSQNDEGKSLALHTACFDELRKQFPATELKVAELSYQTPITEKQLDAACGKSVGGLILLCSLPQDPEKLKSLFLNEDQPKYKTHFLVLSTNSNNVRDFFTSHGESFTVLQCKQCTAIKQSSATAMTDKASAQELFDQFYELTTGRTESSGDVKAKE